MKSPDDIILELAFMVYNNDSGFDDAKKEIISMMKAYAKICCEEQKRQCANYAELGFDSAGNIMIDENSILNCPNIAI